MPGFSNGHFHSELAIGPGLYEYIFERANNMMVHPIGGVDEEDIYNAILWGLTQVIRGGQTGAIDFFYGRLGMLDFSAPPALQAYLDSGFRTAFGLVSRDQNIYAHVGNAQFLARLPTDLANEVSDSTMGYAWPVDEIFRSFRSLAKTWHERDDRIRLIVAPDWTPACSDELYSACRNLANEFNTGLTTHCLETRSEMLYSLRAHGMSALERLDNLNVLGPDVTLAHFVWVTDEDIKRFADSGAIASMNPGSNLRLSTGICRARDIIKEGGNIVIGTDGISFSGREDFFQELRLACYLQRTPNEFEVGRLNSAEFLRTIGENGARAMGWEDRLGKIAPGYLADLLVLKKERIFFPKDRYLGNQFLDVLIDATESQDIDSVIINGQTVMSEGKMQLIDETALRTKVEDAAERLYRAGASTQQTQLSARIDPYVLDFYKDWYDAEVEPAYLYNPRHDPEWRYK
jgi:5-methylthioadenosine/S-adenosylhomocysteine deaminase